eukprot:828296-Pleurochrysis_carterae.AAC.6
MELIPACTSALAIWPARSLSLHSAHSGVSLLLKLHRDMPKSVQMRTQLRNMLPMFLRPSRLAQILLHAVSSWSANCAGV